MRTQDIHPCWCFRLMKKPTPVAGRAKERVKEETSERTLVQGEVEAWWGGEPMMDVWTQQRSSGTGIGVKDDGGRNSNCCAHTRLDACQSDPLTALEHTNHKWGGPWSVKDLGCYSGRSLMFSRHSLHWSRFTLAMSLMLLWQTVAQACNHRYIVWHLSSTGDHRTVGFC